MANQPATRYRRAPVATKRCVDQEERDAEADERPDRRLPPRDGRCPAQRMQAFDARGEREQPADAGRRSSVPLTGVASASNASPSVTTPGRSGSLAGRIHVRPPCASGFRESRTLSDESRPSSLPQGAIDASSSAPMLRGPPSRGSTDSWRRGRRGDLDTKAFPSATRPLARAVQSGMDSIPTSPPPNATPRDRPSGADQIRCRPDSRGRSCCSSRRSSSRPVPSSPACAVSS